MVKKSQLALDSFRSVVIILFQQPQHFITYSQHVFHSLNQTEFLRLPDLLPCTVINIFRKDAAMQRYLDIGI